MTVRRERHPVARFMSAGDARSNLLPTIVEMVERPESRTLAYVGYVLGDLVCILTGGRVHVGFHGALVKV